MALTRSIARGAVADEALIRTVFEAHGRAILAFSERLLRDRQAAEDVVQEVLVRAWMNPEVLVNGKGSVRGWCLTVARNLVVDRIRASSARPAEVGGVEPTATQPGDHADTTATALTVGRALDRLSVEHREVLSELYLRGHDVSQTSQALGIPPGTVRSRCYYALRALRGDLAPATSGELR